MTGFACSCKPPTGGPTCPIHAIPSPLRPWEPLTDEDKRRVDEWLAELAKALPIDRPAVFHKPIDWPAEIARWQEIVDQAPPRHTEPIKLTPGQWAVLPHGDPRIPPYARPLGDLLGIPVVIVDSEEESTPVAEGWLKPKRKRPWWLRLWPWGRR